MQWKSNSEKKWKKKVNQEVKKKLEGNQGNMDWNENLIRDFEERQDKNQRSTFEIFKSIKFERKVDEMPR